MAEASEPRARVVALKVVERALDGNNEHGLVAVFDLKVAPFSIYGAKLYRRRKGSMIAAMPGNNRGDGEAFGIRLDDEDLREEITRAACDVARVLGANVDPIKPADA